MSNGNKKICLFRHYITEREIASLEAEMIAGNRLGINRFIVFKMNSFGLQIETKRETPNLRTKTTIDSASLFCIGSDNTDNEGILRPY